MEVPSHRPAEGRWVLGLVALAVLAGAALRLWLALTDDGIYWPDEIYQGLEPAHRLVHGYGLVAWEFREGARNWALPGAIAGLLQLFDWVGWENPAQYVRAAKAVFALVGAGTLLAVWRLGRALGASEQAAALGAVAFALMGPAIYFAPRAMSEPLSTLPLVLGFCWALPSSPGDRTVVAGASMLGLATLLRLQNGVFCVGLVGVLLARRAWRQAAISFAVLVAWAVIYGLLDRLTWGSWFHSAAVYLRFNLVEGKASQWGTADAGYYFRTLFTSMPALSVCLLVLPALAWRSARGLWLVVVAFLLLHSAVPHKELRFIFAALPLLCALAAVGLGELPRRARPIGFAALLFASLLSAGRHRSLTFGELGQYLTQRPGTSAYDDFGAINRLLLEAHERADLCGLKIESAHLAWTGGQTYLHREVPLYPHSGPPRTSRRFNYAITAAAWMREGELVASEGSVVLVRFPWECRPDPGYSDALP